MHSHGSGIEQDALSLLDLLPRGVNFGAAVTG
jgi:hypothetical protein